jgi:hypothetical protein
MRGHVICAFLVLLLASSCLFGEQKQPKAGKRTSAHLSIPAWLENEPATPLEQGTISASVGGREVEVVEVSNGDSSMVLLLVIDLAEDLILIDQAKQSLIEQVFELSANTYVGVLRIPEMPMVLVDPTKDREKVTAAIEEVPLSGRAGLLEMIEVISGIGTRMVERSGVRTAILYVTDSDITNYREDYTNPVINRSDNRDLSRRFPEGLVREKIKRLSESLESSRAPLFVVHLERRNDILNETYQNGLDTLSQLTGGRSAFCRSIAEVPEAIGNMVETIRHLSFVKLNLPAGLPDRFELQMESSQGTLSFRSQFAKTR